MNSDEPTFPSRPLPIPAPHSWRVALIASFFQHCVQWENCRYLKSQQLVFPWGQSLGAGLSQVTQPLLEQSLDGCPWESPAAGWGVAGLCQGSEATQLSACRSE